jgi:hypothetical protein
MDTSWVLGGIPKTPLLSDGCHHFLRSYRDQGLTSREAWLFCDEAITRWVKKAVVTVVVVVATTTLRRPARRETWPWNGAFSPAPRDVALVAGLR